MRLLWILVPTTLLETDIIGHWSCSGTACHGNITQLLQHASKYVATKLCMLVASTSKETCLKKTLLYRNVAPRVMELPITWHCTLHWESHWKRPLHHWAYFTAVWRKETRYFVLHNLCYMPHFLQDFAWMLIRHYIAGCSFDWVNGACTGDWEWY